MVASDLLDRDARVIDIALCYGYDSPTAFARAFKRVHGISPSEAKNGDVKLASYPRLVFTLSVKGEEPMDYNMERAGFVGQVGRENFLPNIDAAIARAAVLVDEK